MANPNDPNAREISRSDNAGPEAARGANAGSRPDFERGDEQRSFEGSAPASDDPPEDHYEPTEVEATRGREQGLGVGARDLARQRDAHRPVAPPDQDDRADGE